MGRFIVRRGLHSLFALVGLVVLVFFLARLTGSPADLYLPIDATVEQRQEFDRRHGFDQPLVAQFGDFLAGSPRATSATRSARTARRSRSCSRPSRPRSGSPP
jgi:ABC-type dipeptide/oligopeptide/nickel transport system permease component